jgi:amino acid transporter
VSADTADSALRSLGYEPSFRRILTRRSLILYGLVILTPTAPYPVYGIVQQMSKGHAALCYLAAMLAMLFTAVSYGRMAGAFPAAGSTYTFVQRGLNAHVGFIAGWGMILDYIFIPMLSVIYAALTAERLVPRVPYLFWAVLFAVSITWINLRGMQQTARAGTVLLWLMSICAAAFLVLAALRVAGHGGGGALLSMQPIFQPHEFSLRAVMAGTGVAALSYIGFDAISTLAEDVREPQRDIAVATVAVCVIQALICVATVYLAALVIPDFRSFANPETVILDIGQIVGGPWMFGALTLVLLVAGLASALAGQAAASRLLFGMGRDGVLSRRIFAHVSPGTNTPTRGIWMMGAAALAGALLVSFQLAVELLNFGAFLGFILVNLSVIQHYYIRGRHRSGWAWLTNLVAPACGAAACLYIWLSLSSKAQMAGFVWVFIGIIYLAILTRGFRKPPATLEF